MVSSSCSKRKQSHEANQWRQPTIPRFVWLKDLLAFSPFLLHEALVRCFILIVAKSDMKLLRASSEPGVLERLKSVLEDAGLECEMRNTLTAGLTGAVPLSDSVPELWLVNDDQLPQAQKVLGVLKSTPSVDGPAWSCPQCGEVLEAQFTSCWKCGTPRQ